MANKRFSHGLTKNQCIPLTITGYTAEGSGVGRWVPDEADTANTAAAEEASLRPSKEPKEPKEEGQARQTGQAGQRGLTVFVPRAAKGDRLLVRIVKPEKTYAFGIIQEILEPSPDRVAPDCPLTGKCGGCVYRHISYPAELQAKEQRVRDAMERIGGLENVTIREILGSPHSLRYRNKAQFPMGLDENGELVMGFYAPHTHRIIPCRDCLLQPESFRLAMEAVTLWQKETGASVYNESTGQGLLRHLYLRWGQETGEILVCLVANGQRLPKEDRLVELLRQQVPGLRSVVLNQNRENTNVVLGKACRTLWGEDSIADRLCGLTFRISPLSFYQVNREQAQRLYQKAAEYAGLTGRETLLDLYCGTGTIGLSMAAQAGKVIGVEIVEPAVKNARENALRNGITNGEFFCADAGTAALELEKRSIRPDVVVLDPPRKGCAPELVDTVARMQPQRVVYVSCDPATLARDLRRFQEQGYFTREMTPVDMFPRTAHVETVAWLARSKE